ncbi:porin family protein [Pedobacter heparinus]|uniref:porin family protein n=1 Tax=Pedobacter heparinus TaxID=984 RepID=UPI00292EAFFC|nr:porin family protein [Pedobacter heparinus]
MKPLILTLALFGLSLGAFAQIGLTAGMNLAKYTYPETQFDVHRKSILAYNFGIQYKKELTEKLFLLPELSYSGKGSRIYYDYPEGYTGPMKNVNKFQYLQLNLPAIVAIPLSDELDYEIGGGLFAAYLLKATQKTVEFDDSYVTEKFASGDLKKMDAGLHLTTGFRMSKMLGFHFRYDLGLMNIEGVNGSPVVKTRNFSINVSCLFAKND